MQIKIPPHPPGEWIFRGIPSDGIILWSSVSSRDRSRLIRSQTIIWSPPEQKSARFFDRTPLRRGQILASYPLSRYELRGKGKFLYAIIFMTSLPVNAILVPVFRMFINLGLQDNLLSIALFMAATNMPYGIWMTKNFMDAVLLRKLPE